MTNYADMGELLNGVYFEAATFDDRFTWEEIVPKEADGLRRFRLTGCAHREADRDGSLCTNCGHANLYEPPEQEAARKARSAK